ncbi:conserved hypothetical protein [Escherichia coli 3431]|nr:conserved hypothetical protein [Escherichia coli 3431]
MREPNAMKNNKLATSELRSLANSAISLNNAANEVMNMWLQSLVNNERNESTARLILAVSELLDSSTSKIESISEKINGLSGHAIGE